LIAAPLLLASGLSGRSYIATGAVGSAAIHVSRIAGYGAGGAIDSHVLLLGGVAAVCITAGNLLGHRVRCWLPAAAVPRIEIGVVLVMMGLALVGAA